MQIPARDDVVMRYVLERNAGAWPDARMASYETGEAWTWADGLRAAKAAARVLRRAGVRQGDAVAVFLPNGPDFMRAWLGVSFLGGVLVPLNVAFKGHLLQHALTVTAPVVAVSAGALAQRLGESGTGVTVLDVSALSENDENADDADDDPGTEGPIEVWDTHHFMFTSGTTGPSRAARNSHLQFALLGDWATKESGLDQDDVFLIDLPLFHGSALSMAAGAFRCGTPVAVRSAPAMSNYWEVARETGATAGFLLSSMVGFLMSKPESDADRNHRLRVMISAPLPSDPEQFCKRFGVAQIITAYGSSEVSAALAIVAGEPLVTGSCGRVRPGFHARLVDENDLTVPTGVLGELVVRHDLPWTITTEYIGMPEATAAAWRNGWFHTGDLMQVDEDGYFRLVDRVKDALRRRGENVSTYEVEREVATHPSVQEVACVGYPSPIGDDDVKVFVVLKEGADLDFGELAGYLAERMPHFMVPRYYEAVERLPKTLSMKVQKFVLRDMGNTAATWDLEADGGRRITRNGLVAIGAP